MIPIRRTQSVSVKLASLLLLTLAVAKAPLAQTAADSGWRPLFNGTNFNGLYVYAVGTGVVNLATNADSLRIGSNTMFRVDSGYIRVAGNPYGYIGTIRQYSHYRVRVQYRWPAGTSASANAGLLINLDSAQVRSSGFGSSSNRPRSIEVNMKRNSNHPWSLWSANQHGPYITTTVTTVPATTSIEGVYNPAGALWTNEPYGTEQSRVINGSLQTNPELPLGQWNQGEVTMRGADTATFTLNGQIRTRGWNFQTRQTSTSATPRIPYDRGNIGLQSEGAQIWYRNFEIMELDSVTGLPLHATTSIKAGFMRNGDRATSQGLWTRHAGLTNQITVPAGVRAVELYDLGGRKVWSQSVDRSTAHNGSHHIAVPGHVGTGVLRVRFLQ